MLRAAAQDDDQAGFTLIELVVVTTLLLVVLGSILGMLESLTSAQATTSTRIDDAQSARLTLAQFSHDVRSAASVVAPPVPSDYATTVDVILNDSGHTEVQWVYDPVAQTLTRNVVTSGQPSATSVLDGVANGTGPPPVFAWLAADGTNLITAAWATTADVAHCAVVVQATVVYGIHRHLAPQTQQVQTALANPVHAPGCP
jgi:prepilin-type N-terminal cleavage/methylation domain-containing protein